MVRKLTTGLTLGTLLLPSLSYSLGLGNIHVHSNLNQPFSAEIEVFSEDPKELNELRARLAGTAEFQRVGLDRPIVLSRLRFEVNQRNGKTVIAVRSVDSIKEPFLNFILEANWQSGRILREYAVLLDPPKEIKNQHTAANKESKGNSKTQENFESKDLPEKYGPVQINETLWRIANSLRPNTSVSNHQVIIALFNANKEKFEANNFNGLRTGSILSVPSIEQMRAIPRDEAKAEFYRHQQLWRERRNRLVNRELPKEEKINRDNLNNPQARLINQTNNNTADKIKETPATLAKVTDDNNKVDLTKQIDDNNKAANQNTANLNNQNHVEQEAAALRQKENEALRTKLMLLEEQINNMQRALQNKDENLAALQSQITQLNSSIIKSSPTPEATPSHAINQNLKAEATPLINKQAEFESVATPFVSATPLKTELPVTAKTPLEAEKINNSAATTPPIDVSQLTAANNNQPPLHTPANDINLKQSPLPQLPEPTINAAQSPQQVKQHPTPIKNATEQGSLVDSLLATFLEDTILQLLAAGLLAAILALMFVARRKSNLLDETSSDFPEEAENQTELNDALTPITNIRKSEIISNIEFNQDSLPKISLIKNQDPLAAADADLKSGNYQQGLDVLQRAIAIEPDRTDLKLKIIEIYFAKKDRLAFIEQAKNLNKLLGNNDHPIWNQVLIMGRELAPNDELFSEKAKAKFVSNIDTLLSAVKPDKHIETNSISLVKQPDFNTTILTDDPDLLMPSISKPEKLPQNNFNVNSEALEFDLGELDFSLLDELEQHPTTNLANEIELNKQNDAALESIATPTFSATSYSNNINNNFDDLLESLNVDDNLSNTNVDNINSIAELNLIQDSENIKATINLSDTMDFDLIETPLSNFTQEDNTADLLTFDLPDFTKDQLSTNQDEAETSLIANQDEILEEDAIKNKFDLAQVYLDIGDKEGAQELINEIIKEGNANQRRMAEALLTQII